ncbi:MAG TPA: L-glutamate gamma-semialdehyde dehydrogenase [Candidatus Krumholzibacteria bacterium]|nr:L-glutamate gamma-semialdehyde dehydrogenase [Candidatus Krumholzibacteria bacterium]HRX50486.1 L-glutamate gamma-semialdehyde dehydrogenase [Candidatus Krumholzibacteria bacterium]
MTDAILIPPLPMNEPVKGYLPGSEEKKELKDKLKELAGKKLDIPLVIGGQEVKTGRKGDCRVPHDHKHVLATYHKAGAPEVKAAVAAARKARPGWAALPFEARAAVFLKAAELLAGPWRQTLNAATMLGQSKTCHQAEIDAACELIDFYRFNVAFAYDILSEQPESGPGMWNMLEQRPLDGFVFAITPFNFTSIAGNLPTAPALMGNTVLWKPASSAVYSAWFIMELLREAGLPDGVINLIPGSGREVGDPVLRSKELAGVHFTGSTEVFQGMWNTIGRNIRRYGGYPRIVGETGGKDFVFVHKSADVDAVVTALVRGAFEYQGQKCSAASRAYIPASLWPEIKKKLLAQVKSIKMGDPADFTNFMGAVIDNHAFETIKGYIDRAKKAKTEARILCGGGCDKSVGYFIEPTVIEALDPRFETMREEIFGPVLTLYVYEDADVVKALKLCDQGSAYALTGAVFSQDRMFIEQAKTALRGAAGNFYINDKPTGAVVGQQPFGGSRASGTNDKAGSYLNLLRWTSPRTIKETFDPPHDYRYGFLAQK